METSNIDKCIEDKINSDTLTGLFDCLKSRFSSKDRDSMNIVKNPTVILKEHNEKILATKENETAESDVRFAIAIKAIELISAEIISHLPQYCPNFKSSSCSEQSKEQCTKCIGDAFILEAMEERFRE